MRRDCRACGGRPPRDDPRFRRDAARRRVPVRAEAIAGERVFPLPVHVCARAARADPRSRRSRHPLPGLLVLVEHDRPLVHHFDDYAAGWSSGFQPSAVVEFGCNDGILLAPLREAGRHGGRRRPLAQHHRDGARRGLDVVTGYFDAATAAPSRERRRGRRRDRQQCLRAQRSPRRDPRGRRTVLAGNGRALPRSDVRRRPARAAAVGHALPRAPDVLQSCRR